MFIGKNWKIEADSDNIILYRQVGKTKPKWLSHGYFGNLHLALKELVDQNVRDTQLKDFKVVIDGLGRVYDLIKGIGQVTPSDLAPTERQLSKK